MLCCLLLRVASIVLDKCMHGWMDDCIGGWEMGTGMRRFGAAFLVRVGQLETQLYDACLGPGEEQVQDAAAADKQTSLNGKGRGKEKAGDEDAGGEGIYPCGLWISVFLFCRRRGPNQWCGSISVANFAQINFRRGVFCSTCLWGASL